MGPSKPCVTQDVLPCQLSHHYSLGHAVWLSRSLRIDLGICMYRELISKEVFVRTVHSTPISPDSLIGLLITMWHLPLHFEYLIHPFSAGLWFDLLFYFSLIKLSKPQWWSVSRLEGPICTVAGWEELFICSSLSISCTSAFMLSLYPPSSSFTLPLPPLPSLSLSSFPWSVQCFMA